MVPYGIWVREPQSTSEKENVMEMYEKVRDYGLTITIRLFSTPYSGVQTLERGLAT